METRRGGRGGELGYQLPNLQSNPPQEKGLSTLAGGVGHSPLRTAIMASPDRSPTAALIRSSTLISQGAEAASPIRSHFIPPTS